MEDVIILKKDDIEKMELLSQEEMEKLNFHELCAYIGALDLLEKFLEEAEDNVD